MSDIVPEDQPVDEGVDRSVASAPSWAFALSTDASVDPIDALDRVVTAFRATLAGDAAIDVGDLLDAATAGVAEMLDGLTSSTPGARYEVRVGGRATKDHACIDGPDELLTVSIGVLDPLPPAEPVEGGEGEEVRPVEVDGGSFVPVE